MSCVRLQRCSSEKTKCNLHHSVILRQIRPVSHAGVPRNCELADLELVDLGTLRLAETSKGILAQQGLYRNVACAKGEGDFAKYCILVVPTKVVR